MKAIILARVSTEEQKEAGNSLPAQISRLKRYCERKNLDIIQTYSFDESAYKTKRDEFDKILDKIKSVKENVAVCFDKVDRFSRNVFDTRVSALYDLAMEDKIELHFASDNQVINSKISAAEKFQFGISLGLAKYFSDAISDNTRRAIEQKLRNGEIVRKAPIGYLNHTNEDGSKTVILDPERSGYITKIFEMYSTGNHSMQTISDYMSDAGLTSNTPKRGKLKVRQIEHILKNPFYYGEQSYSGELYPHKYDILVSREIFDNCTRIRQERNTNIKIDSKPFILKGLMKCKKCDCAITPEMHKGKYIYYHCTNYKRICKKVFVPEKDILHPIKNLLDNLALPQNKIDELTEALRNNEDSKNKFYKQQINSLRTQADKINKSMEVMYEDRLDGRLSPEIYDNKVKSKSDKLEEINLKIEDLGKANKSYYLVANHILSLAQRASEIFESSEVDEKRQLLGFLFLNLEMEDKKLHFELKKPFKSLYQYNRKTPSEKEAFFWGA